MLIHSCCHLPLLWLNLHATQKQFHATLITIAVSRYSHIKRQTTGVPSLFILQFKNGGSICLMRTAAVDEYFIDQQLESKLFVLVPREAGRRTYL
jgi:hypothetical protein